MKRNFLIWLSTVALAISLRGQDFTNLNFESANIAFVGGISVATSNALPGWLVFSGTNELATVPYNSFIGPFPRFLVGSNSWVIDGNFSVAFGGIYSMSQTGLVPSGAESLLFDATASSLLVSLDGQSLSYMAISNALNSSGISYTIYGADISGFAGQVENLTFSGGDYVLDDIRFSSQAIPEPSAISLVGLGSGVLLYVRKRKRSRL